MIKFADFHCDTLLKLAKSGGDLLKADNSAHLDFPRLQATGFNFQCFAAFFHPNQGQEVALRRTLALLNSARDKIFSLPQVTWLKSNSDIEEIKEGQLLAMLSIEGADFLGSDLFLLEMVYNMGVRMITLTWNGRNSIADGVGVGENCGGLTKIGIEAVKIMETLGIIVDVSHLAEKGFWDLISLADKPFVASHSNTWSVCPHPRNLKDDQIKEINRCGGLIGMNLCPSFIAENREDQDLKTLVKHMCHIAQIASVDNICLGCDFDGIDQLPLHMQDVRDLSSLPALMATAGFSLKEIKNICADNLLNFLKTSLR